MKKLLVATILFFGTLISAPVSAHGIGSATTEACLSGNFTNCDRLVSALGSESLAARAGIEPNILTAVEIGKAGCAAGQLDTCFRYAQILFKKESGRYTDRDAAMNIMTQLCDLGHAKSCEDLDKR